MKKWITLLACVAVFALGEVAAATVLDFEDLYQGVEDVGGPIPSPYHGVILNADAYFVTKNYFPGSGYEYGTTGHVSMFTAGGRAIHMTGIQHFNLESADITSAWYDNHTFTVKGYRDNVLVASFTGITHDDAQYHFEFSNFNDLSKVVFYGGPGQLDIDNIIYTNVPIPSGLLLLGSSLLSLVGWRRFRKD